MAEIKIVKKYPNIRDEDVTEIFQEGYLKGFENGRKNAIHIEWIKKQKVDFQNEDYPFNYCRGVQDGFNDCIDYLIDEWEEEQASLFEKQITEECTSAERFAEWEEENEKSSNSD